MCGEAGSEMAMIGQVSKTKHKTVAWLHLGWWDGQKLIQWSRIRKAYFV